MKVARGKAIWPPPVYCAEFAGGERVRMSVWTPGNKPIGFRSTQHRRMVAQVIANERAFKRLGWRFAFIHKAPEPAEDMTAGWIEWNGQRHCAFERVTAPPRIEAEQAEIPPPIFDPEAAAAFWAPAEIDEP